jgi:uncharacterized protein YggE
MRRLAAALVTALLVVTAGCAGIGALGATGDTTNDAQSGQGPQVENGGRTIQVTAAGSVKTRPDRAVIRVAATARGDDVSAVRDRLSENASSMRQALLDAGLAESQITTTRFNIRRNHRAREDRSEPAFRGHHEFAVTLNDTDRAGEIVVTAVENGATQVRGVQFTISSEKRQRLRQEALSAAMDNARTEAETAATAADLQVTGVDTIVTASTSTRPFERRSAADSFGANAGGGHAPAIESGPVTVSASVQVIYNATRS